MRNRRSIFLFVTPNFYPSHETQNKKVIQDVYFSDLRAGLTKRASDVTVRNFEKKYQTLHKINTYHSPDVNHAWK